MNYSYPIDPDWTKEEIINVVNFFAAIEDAYESKIAAEDLKVLYREFKKVAPGKSDEKQLYREFYKVSGMEPYEVMKQLLKDKDIKFISVNKAQ